MTDISVIIPCYNSNFSKLIKQIKLIEKILNKKKYEIILIFDNGPLLQKKIKKIRSLNKKKLSVYQCLGLLGQQAMTKLAFKLAKGNTIITIDDDLKYEIKNINYILEYFKSKKLDLIIGKEINIQKSLFRKLGSFFVRKIAKYSFNLKKEIFFSSFRIVKKKLAKIISKDKNIFNVIGFDLLLKSKNVSNYDILVNKNKSKSRYSFVSLLLFFIDQLIFYSFKKRKFEKVIICLIFFSITLIILNQMQLIIAYKLISYLLLLMFSIATTRYLTLLLAFNKKVKIDRII